MKTKYLRKIVIVTFFFLTIQNVLCQDYSSTVFIRENTLKNVISYNLYSFLDPKNQNYNLITSSSHFFYDNFIPSSLNELNLSISKSDVKFPDSTFTLYSCTFNEFLFQKDSISRFGNFILADFEKNILLAHRIKNSNHEILFLSGGVFKTPIWQYFDFSKISDVKNYIEIKAYNLLPEEVNIKRTGRKKYFVSFYSLLYNHEIKYILKVHKNKRPTIKEVK